MHLTIGVFLCILIYGFIFGGTNYMKKIKFISALITVLLVVLMSSCSNSESTDTSNTDYIINSIAYPINEYTVIRGEKAPEDIVRAAADLRRQINSLLEDQTVDIKDDWVKGGVITEDIANSYEILVGNTNRPESKEALEGVDDTSFVIKVVGNKIVINAQKTSILLTAIEYFTSECMNISDGKLFLTENYCYISAPVPQVVFINNNQHNINVVYLDSLDNSVNSSNENDRLDLDVVYAKNLRDTLSNFLGFKLGLSTDWYKPGTDIASAYEILVGNTSRDETMQFLKTLNYNEYGFTVIGNKIVVSGWNETTTELAVEKFISYFKENAVKNEDGTFNFSMLQSDRLVYEYSSWYVDYPVFEGGRILGTQDSGYGNLQAYFVDATVDSFDSYCDELEQSGFILYSKNIINDNVHKCYTSEDGMLYVYYVPVESSVRIISCPAGKYNLPKYITEDSVPAYEKITDSSITQMSLSYSAGNFGLCHIITLEDGSFIVYDGGGNSNNDYIALYNTLKALNKRSDGKIVISAWILTHEHWDHYTNFSTFCKHYSNYIVLEGLYCNTPSGSFAYNGYNPNYYMNNDFANLSSTLGGVPKYIVHTGMKFYIKNACVEILYTQEDLYPTKLYYFNDSTMVSRITISGQTIMYLGDVRYEGSDIMCDRYKDTLKCDIVQISHHGFDGGTIELYGYLNPQTALWPTSKENFMNMSSGSTSSNYLIVDNYILNTLKVPTNIYAEPTATIALPYHQGDRISYWDQ